MNFWAEVAKTLISAVVGGGIVALFFGLINRSINKKLTAAENDQKKKKINRIMRIKLEDALFQTIGRLLFWLYRFAITGDHNGELDKAYKAFEAAEQSRKEFKNGIYAESEQDC